MRVRSKTAAPIRLLPSADAYYLLWGHERELLVPEARHRNALWTSVWPGALLMNGEIVRGWHRSEKEVSIEAWRGLSSVERNAVEAEAALLPLPGLSGPITIRWA